MPFRMALAVCACVLGLNVQVRSDGDMGILRVGLYENHPKIYSDEQGGASGFFPILISSIAELEGWQIEFVAGSWQEGLERLASGAIDVMPDVALSPERQRLFDFNEETVLVSWAAVYVRPDISVQSFKDLTGLRVALLRGGIYSEGPSSIRAILNRLELDADYVEFESYRDVFKAISDGRADAGVVNNIFGSAHQDDYAVQLTPILFQPSQLRFAFSKKDPDRSATFIARLDARLKEFKKDPASPYYAAIEQHLYGVSRSAAVVTEDLRAFLSPAEKDWISRHHRIRLGIDPEFYPFVFRDEHGAFKGIGADFVALLNERLGLNMEASPPLSWTDAMEQFQRGELDVLPCVGITKERSEYALFTKAVVEYQRVILTRSDFPFIAGIDDLALLRVGVQASTSHDGYLRENTSITPERYDSLQSALMALSAGKVDAIVGNLASATYWIRRLNLINLKVAAPVGDERYTLHIAVRKDWPELVTILEKGLDLISPEEKQGIRNRWISIDYRPGIEPRVAWRIGLRIAGVVVLVLAAVLLWSYNLKKEIHRRTVVEKQLKFRIGFERLVSETLSRFIAVPPEQVEREIQIALAEMAAFTNATAVCLYQFNADGTVGRTLAGGEIDKLESSGIHPASDPPDAPWLVALKSGRPVVAHARPHTSGNLAPTMAAPPWLGGGSLLEVPHAPDEVRPGFLCLYVDGKGEANGWREEDISLFRLVGQIFSEALRHRDSEMALRRFTDDLEAANRRLQELDRLKSLFIASVSHELRTPLNSIIGFTGVILKGMSGPLNDRQKDQLSRVYQSANHLLALITDIIDISKIEAGHIDVHTQEFVLEEVIREVVESVRPMAQAKGLRIETRAPVGLTVRSDRKRVRQCLLNFLSNAVKYSEKGTITVDAFFEDQRAVVTVTDQGIGISEEDRSKLFSPFVRLDSRLRVPAGGTGLGLYLTRKVVVELLHGEIRVTGNPGGGSVFAFAIPRELDVVTHRREAT